MKGRYLGTDTVIFDNQELKNACIGMTTKFNLREFQASIVGLHGSGMSITVPCTINGTSAHLVFDCRATPQLAPLKAHTYLVKRDQQLVIKLNDKTFDTSYEPNLFIDVSYVIPVISNVNIEKSGNLLTVHFTTNVHTSYSIHVNQKVVYNTNQIDASWLNDGENTIFIVARNYEVSSTEQIRFYKTPAVECKLTDLTCNSTTLNKGESLIVNYTGENITKAKIEFMASTNVVSKTIDHYISGTHIDTSDLADGSHTVRLTVYNIGEFYTTSDSDSIRISIVELKANVREFTVKGISIDSPITCTWQQENVEHWTVQAIQNGVVKATKSGTSMTECTFNTGEFTIGGETIFRIIASNRWNHTQTDVSATLSYTKATISMIDLPGSTINTDENFKIAWVSNNQTSFKVELDGKIYEGTTAKSITIPKGVISKGLKTIRVTIYFANAYYSNQASMETTFTSYGKPQDPVITIPKLISSALPNITWESKEQEAYNVVIKKSLDIVEKSENTISTAQYYKVKKALENNETYLVEVKIKNKYGLWSNTSKMEFTTQFSVPNKPTLAYTLTNEGSIVLNVSTNLTGDTEYKNTEIWKKEPYGEWKRMAYNLKAEDAWEDFYCGGEIEYQYKAINEGVSGGKIESDVIKATAKVKFYTFYNVEDMYQNLTFKYDAKVTVTAIQNIAQNLFAGANAPMIESDGKIYFECEMQFSSRNNDDMNRLLDLMKQAKLLLYKDCKGHKYFGKIINNPQFPRSDLGIMTFNLSFCEEVFLEEDVYDGGNSGKLPLVWDGTWMFNGTKTYGGK